MLYTDVVALALADTDRTSDAELLSVIDSKLRLVEARVNRYLLVQQMVVKTVINMDINTEFYGPPVNYSALKSIFTSPVASPNARTTLEYLNPEQMSNVITAGNIQPNYVSTVGYYSIVNDSIQVYPLKDSTYNLNLWYFQDVPQLTSIANSNWLSEKHPDCYISGLCAEIMKFARSTEGYTLFDKIFTDSLASIDLQDDVVSWSGTPLIIRVG